MIKVIAALTMLIDHIGYILYPSSLSFRIIGRLSMPLYAYCIARGFYYSRQHGTLHKYLLNMQIFALVSQIPYHHMTHNGFNIGYTWLISLLLLLVITEEYRTLFSKVFVLAICAVVVYVFFGKGIFSVDYGVYGIITPLLFYLLISTGRESLVNYLLVLSAACGYYIFVQDGSPLQIISIYSAFILTVRKNFDKKIKLPKWVFYTFYPVHIIVLLVIRYLI